MIPDANTALSCPQLSILGLHFKCLTHTQTLDTNISTLSDALLSVDHTYFSLSVL